MVLSSFSLSAHLCNDVFEQAKDDLAVKVDIRDGQLRINKEATFRVYLMNTMDRDIADINLKVESDAFDATVSPSKSWKKFPVLRTTRKGGQKEYFEVTLRRKPNLPDGKYKINLTLFNGRDASMVFKTLDIEEAADIQKLPEAPNLTIDGVIKKEEWQNSILLSNFYNYEKKGKYFFSTILKNQPRIRLMADKTNLYISAKLEEGQNMELLITDKRDDKPKVFSIDLNKAKIEGSQNAVVKSSTDGAEIKIPLSSIGIKDDSFLLNLVVKKENQISYWRGNSFSFQDPLVFAEFTR